MIASTEYGAVMRVGRVREISPEKHAARVEFWDMDEQLSDWLPILSQHTHVDKHEGYTDIGEKVLCLMSGQGDEFGVILGSFYDESTVPPVQSPDKQTVAFGDGTLVQYDRSSHELHIHCVGDLKLETDNTLHLKATEIKLEGMSHIEETAPRIDLN